MNKEDRKDLVERLRNTPTERTWDSVGRPYDYPKHLPLEAADEIDRLRRELEEARRKAFEEAAKIADAWASTTMTSTALVIATAIRKRAEEE